MSSGVWDETPQSFITWNSSTVQINPWTYTFQQPYYYTPEPYWSNQMKYEHEEYMEEQYKLSRQLNKNIRIL